MGIVERSFVLCCELCEENFELLHNSVQWRNTRPGPSYGKLGRSWTKLGRLNCMELQALHSSFQQLFEYYYYSCP